MQGQHHFGRHRRPGIASLPAPVAVTSSPAEETVPVMSSHLSTICFWRSMGRSAWKRAWRRVWCLQSATWNVMGAGASLIWLVGVLPSMCPEGIMLPGVWCCLADICLDA